MMRQYQAVIRFEPGRSIRVYVMAEGPGDAQKILEAQYGKEKVWGCCLA